MKSDIIYDATVEILKNIDTGDVNISDLYVDFVIKMNFFFEKLVEFSKNISKLIHSEKLILVLQF